MNVYVKCVISLLCLLRIDSVWSSDITYQAFGAINDAIIAAFGDFNSDELTDVFVTSNNGRTLEILLASDVEPLLRRSPSTRCDFKRLNITSIVPGDFDGDAYMDALITSKPHDANDSRLEVYILWGGSDTLNCTDETAEPLITVIGEPVALDYNRDMIIDLFGLDSNGTRMFWIFSDKHVPPREIQMHLPHEDFGTLSIPHAHAYLDLNNDFKADLLLTTDRGFEIWHGQNHEGFKYKQLIPLPTTVENAYIGQSIFLDVELNGKVAQLLPVCYDSICAKSSIVAFVNGKPHDLQVNFKDDKNVDWRFVVPDAKQQQIYQNSITLRGGDFNLDSYPDLLVTLRSSENGNTKTFLMENVACANCPLLTRSFEIRWHAFAPYSNNTVVGAFYDFYQDGILDVIFVQPRVNNTWKPIAFRNTLDYDANFVKVMVLTGLTNADAPTKRTPLGRKKRTYGTNLPGPRIAYKTTKPDGDSQSCTSVQIPQSAYYSLHLPYTIFGLGRSPNFVDSLTVGLSSRNRTWTQLIPNSQMVVVPWPVDKPSKWKAQLFITPSKLIWMSVISLGATCAVITLIILVLHIKERREDRMERLLENQPLHYSM